MPTVRRFPKLVMVVGRACALAGLIVAGAGVYSRSFVVQQLASPPITTPEAATSPNAPETTMATALSMATIIQYDAAARANGLTYAQMGRFAAASRIRPAPIGWMQR